MLSSAKFWIPVGISIVVGIVGVIFSALGMLAGGAHAKPASTGLGDLFFPFAALVEGVSGGFAVYLFALLTQFPIYGIIAGYSNFKDMLKSVSLAIVTAHILAYLLASYR